MARKYETELWDLIYINDHEWQLWGYKKSNYLIWILQRHIFRAQENNDSVNSVAGSADQGESGIKFLARVNKYQRVTQEGRDEGTAGMAFIGFLWFILNLIEGLEQKGPFYVYGQ